MAKFHIHTIESVGRSYIVTADNEDEARAKLERGEYDKESPGEALDCEIVDVEELQ